MDKKILNEMFDNLLHIGNKTNYWNPRMKEYIYGSVNGIHVFNLIKTSGELEKLKSVLKEQVQEGKKILFVATKLQARSAFAKLATDTWNFYVTEKWVPGLLTNFKTIRKRITSYLKLLRDSETNAFDILTKKEKASKLLELEKLNKAFKWLKEMKKVPDLIFVVDGFFESQALREANSLNIKSLAVLNTNGDPYKLDSFVPANTNSVKSINYIVWELKSCFSWVKVTPKTLPKKLTDRKISASKEDLSEKTQEKVWGK